MARPRHRSVGWPGPVLQSSVVLLVALLAALPVSAQAPRQRGTPLAALKQRIIEGLFSPNETIRRSAVRGLEALGVIITDVDALPRPTGVVPPADPDRWTQMLAAELRSRDPQAQRIALLALGPMATDRPAAVERLLERLRGLGGFHPGELPTNLRKPRTFADRFDAIVAQTERAFFDRRLLARVWTPAVRQDYRERARRAPNLDAFAGVINEMLGRLKVSHAEYFTRDQRAYYEVGSILGVGIDLQMPTVRAVFKEIEGKWFVLADLHQDSRKERGNDPLLVGDRVVSVDGRPFAPIAGIRDKVGKTVELWVERHPGAPLIAVRRMVESVHPVAPYVDDMLYGARWIERGGLRLGYCRCWWMGRLEIYGMLFHLLEQFRAADGLILDLRDGWGGTPEHYSELFNPKAAYPVFGARPLVVLINAGSRSAKEVVAEDFKKTRRAILVGETTHKAVLGSAGFLIGSDGLLLLPVAHVPKEWEQIEGRGVAPDIRVPFEVRYAAGHDPQVDRAVEALADRIRHGPAAARVARQSRRVPEPAVP